MTLLWRKTYATQKLICALCMVWQSWKTGDFFITVNYLGSFNSKWCLTTRKRKKSQKLRKSKNQDLESNLVQFATRNYLPREIFWKRLAAFSCRTKRIIFTFSACYLGKVLLILAVIWTEISMIFKLNLFFQQWSTSKRLGGWRNPRFLTSRYHQNSQNQWKIQLSLL